MNVRVELPPYEDIVNDAFTWLFDNQDRYVFLWGGRNSSKSVSTSRKIIVRMLTEKHFRCVLVRKTYNTIKDSQFQTLKDDVYAMRLENLFEFNVAPMKISCKLNNNMIIARGCDDPKRLKSIKDPSCVWYEEASEMLEQDFITVSTTLRSEKAKYIQEMFTLNPEVEGDYRENWLFKRFLADHYHRGIYSFKGTTTINLPNNKKLERSYTVHHSTYHDNDHLTIEQIADIEGLKEINPFYYNVYCLGLFGNKDIPDRFFKNFNESHVKEVFVDLDMPLHISFDENVNPYPALTVWQADKKDVYQVKEFCLRSPNNKLKTVCKTFTEWAKGIGFNNIIFIYGDATSAKEDTKLEAGLNYFTMMRNELSRNFSCRIRKSSKNPPVALSAEFINTIFENNFAGCSITIGENCKESINDYLLAQEATDGSMKKPKKDGVEILGHLGDCLRYYCVEYFKDEFRQFQNAISGTTEYVVGERLSDKSF